MKGNFDLDPAQWAALRRLLDDALMLAPAERATWLAALAPEFEVLQPRLRALLAHADAGNEAPWQGTLPKIETAQFAAAHGAGQHAGAHDDSDGGHDSDDSESGRSGQMIGPYRLLRLLGAGGMGEVWLAERTDMLQKRPVALKLPQRLLAGRAALAERLAREREILAALNHPNIARLYDAGVAADGQSYLALEYVEGERIDSYCARKELAVPARLRLFLQVARAVAHAHANLVVHRDLKPSNILVTEDGEVRLLDFGIAKLIEQGEGAETDLTQLGGRALTPDYASPEQILGQPITTASDIYSLGVVLFELLAGARPYRLKRDSRAALEEAIVQAELARPSDAAAPALRKRLRGDLDTIVLKALKKAPLARYATANGLAEDIERHLANEPVLARPDTRLYRLRKFGVRHRLAASASAAVMVAIAAGAGAVLWQAHVAIQERQRAQEVKEFIADIFREASPYSGAGGKTLSAVDLLQQAEKKLSGAMIGQPEVRIELAALIGESLMALGDIDAAEPVIDRAALESRQALGERDGQTVRIELLQSQIHRLRGRAKEARAELDRILPVLRSDPATKPIDLAIALAHRTLIAIEEAAYADAEKFAVEGANLAAAKLGDDNEQKVASAILLALAYRYTKKFEQARDAARVAYRAAVARFGEASPHPRVVEAKTTYGRALADTGELAAGIALIDSAVADLRSLTGPDSLQVGVSLQNLVAYRIDLGDLAAADRNAAEALRIVTAQVQSESLTFAGTLSARAHARLARRDAAAALAEFSRAIPILERVIGAEREATLLARTGRALALAFLGQLDDAQREISAVAALLAQQAGRKDGAMSDVAAGSTPPMEPLLARVEQARGTIARMRGDFDTALQLEQRVAGLTDARPKLLRERMRALAEIGLVRMDQGDAAAAAAAFEQALREFEVLEARITPARAEALIGLGRARLAQGRPADALAPLQAADAFWRDLDAGSRWAGAAAFWLAHCHESLGHTESAQDLYTRAAAALARSPAPSDAPLAAIARRSRAGAIASRAK